LRLTGGGGSRNGGGQRWVATADDVGKAPLEDGALEEDVAAAGLAAEPDVGTQPVHEPGVATARMTPSKPDDIAEE
jgi:hypothetical protein